MSEPDSLYMQVPIAPDNFKAFMESKALSPLAFSDWEAWLATKEYFSTLSKEDIAGSAVGDITVGQCLVRWLDEPRTGTRSVYDAAKEHWELKILAFSENFLEYIAFLSVLRGVSSFMQPGQSGFLFVYDHMFGREGEEDVTAYLELSHEKSDFCAVNKDRLDTVKRKMDALLEELQNQWED